MAGARGQRGLQHQAPARRRRTRPEPCSRDARGRAAASAAAPGAGVRSSQIRHGASPRVPQRRAAARRRARCRRTARSRRARRPCSSPSAASPSSGSRSRTQAGSAADPVEHRAVEDEEAAGDRGPAPVGFSAKRVDLRCRRARSSPKRDGGCTPVTRRQLAVRAVEVDAGRRCRRRPGRRRRCRGRCRSRCEVVRATRLTRRAGHRLVAGVDERDPPVLEVAARGS